MLFARLTGAGARAPGDLRPTRVWRALWTDRRPCGRLATLTMLTIRRSHERGHADHGWLDSHHTFSFAGYQDPRHMGFRTLRVINEDRVAPGKGFGTHSHFLQIWILPEARGAAPGYEQKRFEPEERRGRLRLIASRDGREGSVVVHQDAALYAALLGPGQAVTHQFAAGRQGWLQVARGVVTVVEATLHAGDGAAIQQTEQVEIVGVEAAELLLFDLA